MFHRSNNKQFFIKKAKNNKKLPYLNQIILIFPEGEAELLCLKYLLYCLVSWKKILIVKLLFF